MMMITPREGREEDEVMRGNIEGREARGTSNKIYLGRSSPRHKGRAWRGKLEKKEVRTAPLGVVMGRARASASGHAHKGFRRADPNAIRCLRAHSTPLSQFQSTRDNGSGRWCSSTTAGNGEWMDDRPIAIANGTRSVFACRSRK